jgi:hypothetical protein
MAGFFCRKWGAQHRIGDVEHQTQHYAWSIVFTRNCYFSSALCRRCCLCERSGIYGRAGDHNNRRASDDNFIKQCRSLASMYIGHVFYSRRVVTVSQARQL